MKLDDTVCRGSLIIHRGESYVVLAVGWGKRKNLYDSDTKSWKITPTPKEGTWRINSILYVDEGVEVDTFFPGAVFEIPDYIK